MLNPQEFDDDNIEERSVHDITRPASHGNWPEGSRVADSAKLLSRRETQVAPSAGRRSIPNQASLEMLPAENISPQSFDIELDEYGSDGASEYTSAESDFEELNLIPDPAEVARERQAIRERRRREEEIATNQNPDDNHPPHAMLDLVKFDDEDDDDDLLEDTSSEEEEEPEIIKDLKNQITSQVRCEMKNELEIYRVKRERLKGDEQENKDDESEFEGMDPKLKEAILKMRKYDRILLKKMKKEKQVKRDRILLQRRLRDELENIKPDGRDEQKEVLINTQKFLSLAPPPPKQNGDNDVDFDSPPVTPVFQTQFIDPNSDDKECGKNNAASNVNENMEQHMKSDSKNGRGDGKSRMNSTRSDSEHSGRRQKKKDYIKRNIELASDAANMIAMTDDEKKRLEDLLSDLEAITEYDEADLQSSNPYQITLTSGEGYQPTADEMRRLEEIDERLQAILPADDFRSIASTTPREKASQQSFRLFARSEVMSSLDVDQPGEQVLKDTREGRSLQQRLQMIEQELAHLTTAVDLEIESPTLSENQLNDLLEQCSRTMSRATEETNSIAAATPMSMSTERSLYQQATPHLPDNVLQNLLAQARSELRLTERSSNTTPQNEDQHTLSPSPRPYAQQDDRDMMVESVTDEDLLRESVRNSSSVSRSRQDSATIKHFYRGVQGSTGANNLSSHFDDSDSDYPEPDKFRLNRTDNAEKRPFLPEINTNVSLSTQPVTSGLRLNNESSYLGRPASSGRASMGPASALSIRNSFSENDVGISLVYGDETTAPAPHPPPGDKRQTSAERNRSLSSLSRKDNMQS